jgi:release factor H-coupled RctB family protein
MESKVTFLHEKSVVDPDAVKQLKFASALPGMLKCVGMPDLHPGGKYPVGASFIASEVFPELVGQDIGCGMTLFELDCAGDLSERRLEKMCKALRADGLEEGSNREPHLPCPPGLKPAVKKMCEKHQRSFGTIGGGNHFAEFQQVEREDEQGVVAASRLHLLIHSGSRTLGEQVLKDYREGSPAKTRAGTPGIGLYLAMHDVAVSWARQSREEIARRVATACGVGITKKVLDICHNSVVGPNAAGAYVHRKGAAPTDCGLVAIPGSRGAMTYIVRPTDDVSVQKAAGWSVAHGAGRVIGRKDLQRKLEKRYPTREACEKALSVTALGGKVVFRDHKILRQEAPEAYKDIDDVVGDLMTHDIVSVVAVMRPVVTCKL